jgi:hypothetical protein
MFGSGMGRHCPYAEASVPLPSICETIERRV